MGEPAIPAPRCRRGWIVLALLVLVPLAVWWALAPSRPEPERGTAGARATPAATRGRAPTSPVAPGPAPTDDPASPGPAAFHLRIGLLGGGRDDLGPMRASLAFNPYVFLRDDDLPWPEGRLREHLIDPDASERVFDVAAAEGYAPDTLPDDDPWRLVLAAEVERRRASTSQEAVEDAVVADAARALGLPEDVDRGALFRQLDLNPEAQEAFWSALREGTLAVRVPDTWAVDRLAAHRSAPVEAREIGTLYAIDAAERAGDNGRVADLAMGLLASTDDPDVARGAVSALQRAPGVLTGEDLAMLDAWLREEPDQFPYVAQLAMHAADLAGSGTEAARWVGRVDAWTDAHCACVPTHEPYDATSRIAAACQALCEQAAALRPGLLRSGALSPRDWRDRLRLAADRCHEESPLDAAVEGHGAWDAGWTWTGWPDLPWTRCFVSASNEPPVPSAPLGVRVEITER